MNAVQLNMLLISICCSLLAALSVTASATSGGTCFQVRNVESDDVLNIRRKRSAKSNVVATIPAQQHGIIALEGACEPTSVSLSSRWCRIAYYDGDLTARGFVKRRYLEPSECP